MRICIIGKFPPIQGGVSMRTYWTAHSLAQRGHEVHVVTNAKEVGPPFRMYMRPEDWKRCEARYADGSVTVHWTEPADRSQSYIPMASPFVSKLAAVAAGVHSDDPFDVVYSHYLEPYGVAGHLASQIARVPHVVRMAGSDAGRLWHHPQLEPLYDHVLQSAEIIIAAGVVGKRAVQRGVAADRIADGGGLVLPEDVFSPDGARLDIAALRAEIASDSDFRDLAWGDFQADRPYFGLCGKLGDNKGSFALLAAIDRLKRAGLDIGLVALAHGHPAVEKRFRTHARKLGVTDRVLQIPFLPHWRVPEFIRGCLAVCCLEQDFPIRFHMPNIAREVLLCGTCLVASTEVLRKLPAHGRLPHGYGCVAIRDVNDIETLTNTLAAIVRHPAPTRAVGARGRSFARELQRDIPFPQQMESILKAAVARQRFSSTGQSSINPTVGEEGSDRFPLTRLAATTIKKASKYTDESAAPVSPDQTIDLVLARQVLADVEKRVVRGNPIFRRLAPAVRAEIAIAAAEGEAAKASSVDDPLFRLQTKQWAIEEDDLVTLVPVRNPQLRVVEFDYDVSEFMELRSAVDFAVSSTTGPSYIVAFGGSNGDRRSPLLVDAVTARILELCDGTRTAREIASQLEPEGSLDDNLDWIENLFLCGLLHLHDLRDDSAAGGALRSIER